MLGSHAIIFLVTVVSVTSLRTQRLSNTLSMKWSFEKGMGSLKELGAIGNDGELYFHPSKSPKLTPLKILGKPRTIPIFTQQNILLPGSTEWIHVFEMRSRHMLNDIGDGVFGFTYTSQQYQKLGLVGTLARVKQRKILEDGRTFVAIEGLERFFIKECISEKPYIRAKVQGFSDYTESSDYLIDAFEKQIFDEVRFNMKLMKILFPSKNYSLNNNLLQHKPALAIPGVRTIKTLDAAAEAERRSKFSFSVIDMLQIPATTKLLLLQEHVLEKRYARLLNALELGGTYLKEELRKRGVMTDEGIRQLLDEVIADYRDVEAYPASSWQPENFENGQWVQRALLM